MKIKHLLSLLLLFSILSSCKITKQITTYENVKNGQDLGKITLISFDSFFYQWINNKKISKVDLNIREINKDDQFTYFGKPSPRLIRTKWIFFKVHTDTIIEQFPNYSDFYGSELRDYLWNKVIPKEDIELWKYNTRVQEYKMRSNCPYKKNKPNLNYLLVDKTVVLEMTWDIKCTELEGLKNKTYKAVYNLITKNHEGEVIESVNQ